MLLRGHGAGRTRSIRVPNRFALEALLHVELLLSDREEKRRRAIPAPVKLPPSAVAANRSLAKAISRAACLPELFVALLGPEAVIVLVSRGSGLLGALRCWLLLLLFLLLFLLLLALLNLRLCTVCCASRTPRPAASTRTLAFFAGFFTSFFFGAWRSTRRLADGRRGPACGWAWDALRRPPPPPRSPPHFPERALTSWPCCPCP